jgi:photosystem II stability/assembly factor-like uncharacterized protein
MAYFTFKLLALFIFINFYTLNLNAQWEKMGGLYGDYYGLASDGNKLIAYNNTTNNMYNHYISLDTGQTWIKMNIQKLTLYSSTGYYIQGNNIFQTHDIDVTMSKDNGQTWTLTTNPNPKALNSRIIVEGNDVYLITRLYDNSTNTTTFNIYKYNVTTNKWDIQSNFPENTYNFTFTATKIYALSSTGVFATNRSVLNWIKNTIPTDVIFDISDMAASDNALIIGRYASKDDGKTWKVLPLDDGRRFYFPLYKNSKFFYKKAGIVWVSTDNTTTWRVLNNGWNNDGRHSNIARNMVIMGNTLLASTESIFSTERATGIMKMDITEEKWSYLPQSPLQFTNIMNIVRSGNTLLANTYYGTLYSSSNEGRTWVALGKLPYKPPTDIYDGQKSLITKDSFIFFLGSLHPFDGQTFDSTYMIRSSDYGKTWKKDNTMKEFTSYYFQGDTLYLSTNQGIFKSTRPYTIFNQINTANIKSFVIKDDAIIGYDISSNIVRFNKNNGQILPKTSFSPRIFSTTDIIVHNNYIVITSVDSVHLSSDNGFTWQSKKIPNSNILMYSESLNGTILTVDAANKAFSSKDNGSTWSTSNIGLPVDNTYINRKVGHLVSNGFVFISFSNYGIYRRSISDFTSNSLSDNGLNIRNLEIFPNPTSDVINFELSSDLDKPNSELNVEIFNTEGAVISSQKKAFEVQNTIHIPNFSNGLYIVKIQVGSQYYIGKILINKS